MARKVITFEERKKTSYPSRHGLYVAEILLLEFCGLGKYPKPNGRYPGLWWFERQLGFNSMAEPVPMDRYSEHVTMSKIRRDPPQNVLLL